ncbi:MAG: DsrE family protein [Spirosomataceae bacterium]
MKRPFILIILLLCLMSNALLAQSTSKTPAFTATSIGMVIYSNDVETIWNALRLANYSKNAGDTVSVFLLGKGVELDNLVKENANLKEQSDKFLKSGGLILGCGTCLAQRKNNEPQVCKFSSLADLYALIRKNKTVLTF